MKFHRISLPALLFLAGCQVANPYRHVEQPGSAGITAYQRAKRLWLELRSTPQIEADRQKALATVQEQLELAETQDPGCPLFLQCRALVALQQDDAPAAQRHFELALQRTEDWVPAHLGLSLLRLHADDSEGAARLAEHGWQAIEHLQEGGDLSDVVLLGLPIVTLETPSPRDPAPGLRTGQQRTLDQIHEAMQWEGYADRLPAPDLLAMLRGSAQFAEFRVLRSRNPLSLDAQEAKLESALRHAPDLWEVRSWRALLAWERGDPARAEKLLRDYYYEGARMPWLQQEPMIRTVYLRSCLDAWLGDRTEASLQRCAAAFARLREHGLTYQSRGDLLFAAAEQLFLPDARRAEVLAALVASRPDEARDITTRNQLLVELRQAMEPGTPRGGQP